jgi:AraC-like DNA-binding protein
LRATSSSLEHPDRPLIKFHYRLSGGGSIDFDQSGVRKIAEHRGSVLYMPALHRKRETAMPGKHELSVTLATTPEWLQSRFGHCLGQASSHLQAYASGSAGDFFLLPITMRAAISQAASALLQTELTGQLRHVFFEAKALEILAQSLDVLICERDLPEHAEHRISKHDFEQLREARRILQTEFNLGFKIGELAQRLTMNESRMMHLFKRLYGETVFDFAQRARMEYAAKLLEATERSITDIAYEVGYDYPSNFTTAFKRHFGIPPRAVRKVSPGEPMRA